MYFVTLSYKTDDKKHYQTAIDRIQEDLRNDIVVTCHQMGSNKSHSHYHLIMKPDCGRVAFNRRFRAYMNPVEAKAPALNIKKCSNHIFAYNYCIRDPTYKFTYSRGLDLKQLERESKFAPDIPTTVKVEWPMVITLLEAAGYKFPEPPGKYLKLLVSKGYNVWYIIDNPGRLHRFLTFHYADDFWDEIYEAAAAKQYHINDYLIHEFKSKHRLNRLNGKTKSKKKVENVLCTDGSKSVKSSESSGKSN